jgi:hypothetical protein
MQVVEFDIALYFNWFDAPSVFLRFITEELTALHFRLFSASLPCITGTVQPANRKGGSVLCASMFFLRVAM